MNEPNHQSRRFSGIISALLTPFDSSGQVNETALTEIIQHSLALGVDGFYVCGSTGEGFHLSPEERRAVVEAAVKAVNGQAFVMVNVSHLDPRETIKFARHAEEAGADAISALPPLYYPYSQGEIVDYYAAIVRESTLPLSLYYIPMLSHVPMEESSIRKLSEFPRFMGVKFASEDFALLNRYKEACGPERYLWSGRDVYFLGGLAMGADGAIGSSFVFLGDFFKGIMEACQRGDLPLAQRLQQAASEVHRGLSRYGSYQSYKRALELLGIAAGKCRPPLGPLPKEADAHLLTVLQLLDRHRSEFFCQGNLIIPARHE